MRLLFFAAQYLPTAGGVERYTASLAAALAGRGHSVTVVTSALPGLPAQQRDDYGVEIVRLPSRLLMGGRFPVLRKNAAFRRLAALLWQTPYDLAIINNHFYMLSQWAARQCARHGVPSVMVWHGTKHLSMDNALLDFFGNLYEHAAMRRMRRHCGGFYGVSQACNAWLRHFHIQADGVLYNAVDPAALSALAQQQPGTLHRRLGVPQGSPLVAFIGRFIVEKGIYELLDAYEILKKTHPRAVIVMAGDGPRLEDVRAKAPAGILLTGGLPYAESVALLAGCDVFCLPTYSEGFSSTILEAAALGRCIVTTPTGGSPELITDGESGLLLANREPATIAAALARTLDDPAFAAACGQAVQGQVQARFTWQRTAQAVEAIAAAQPPAPPL